MPIFLRFSDVLLSVHIYDRYNISKFSRVSIWNNINFYRREYVKSSMYLFIQSLTIKLFMSLPIQMNKTKYNF